MIRLFSLNAVDVILIKSIQEGLPFSWSDLEGWNVTNFRLKYLCYSHLSEFYKKFTEYYTD